MSKGYTQNIPCLQCFDVIMYYSPRDKTRAEFEISPKKLIAKLLTRILLS